MNPIQVEDACVGASLFQLGIDPEGKIGAGIDGPRFWVFGTGNEKWASFSVEGGRVRGIVAGGGETGHGRQNVVPGGGVRAQSTERLQPLPALCRKPAVVFRTVGNGQGPELFEGIDGLGFPCGSKTALDGGDGQPGQETQNGNNHQELHQGEGVTRTIAHARDFGGHGKCGQKKVGVVTKM